MKNQHEISKDWLRFKGYTISAAARKIRRSHVHVSMVLDGKRESREVIRLLIELPSRPYIARERLAACK